MVTAAVAARVDLLQIREKQLPSELLVELAQAAITITSGSATRILVNGPAEIAIAAGADGVHLTARSAKANAIRTNLSDELLIGASTHSLNDALQVKAKGADFAVFGPVFETRSKREYGAPVGVESLRKTVKAVAPFPILALGGVSLDNAAACFRAGASGVAAIGLFSEPESLSSIVDKLRNSYREP